MQDFICASLSSFLFAGIFFCTKHFLTNRLLARQCSQSKIAPLFLSSKVELLTLKSTLLSIMDPENFKTNLSFLNQFSTQ